MAVDRQAMGGGKAGRAGADHGDALAAPGCARIELLALFHGDVGGVTLQPADLHGRCSAVLRTQGLLAQRFGGTDAGAHAAENVLVEDGVGGADRIAGRDLADEQRNVDRGRTAVMHGAS